MNASDPRIAAGKRRRRRIPIGTPAKTTGAGVTAAVGLVAVVAGVAGFSTSLAEIVGGLLLVLLAVGYLRGAD